MAEARAPGAEGDKKAAAYWSLLELAPDHPAAAELAPSLDAGFQARAEQARSLMGEAQRAAEKAQATRLDGFREGTTLARDAEDSFKAKAYARRRPRLHAGPGTLPPRPALTRVHARPLGRA